MATAPRRSEAAPPSSRDSTSTGHRHIPDGSMPFSSGLHTRRIRPSAFLCSSTGMGFLAATEGCSLAQLSGLCREAAMDALREDLGAATVGARGDAGRGAVSSARSGPAPLRACSMMPPWLAHPVLVGPRRRRAVPLRRRRIPRHGRPVRQADCGRHPEPGRGRRYISRLSSSRSRTK